MTASARTTTAATVKGEPPVYSYNVRMSAFSVDFMLAERLRWGRSGKVVDFVRQAAETPEQARTRQERLRALIVSLQARMKEPGLPQGQSRHKKYPTCRADRCGSQ